MKFYRYEYVEYASIDEFGDLISSRFPNPKIELREYNLHKETPKGYWIGYGYYAPGMLRGNSRWVSKTAKKRFAYPTKEEALTNLIKRTEKRLGILKRQAQVCEIVLNNSKKLSYD